MLSGRIGKYKYYTLKDIHESIGCKECHARISWWNSIFPDQLKNQHEVCTCCPIFYAVQLIKIYAEQLNEHEWMYEDDKK